MVGDLHRIYAEPFTTQTYTSVAPRAPLPPVLMATVPMIWTSDLNASRAYLRAVLDE